MSPVRHEIIELIVLVSHCQQVFLMLDGIHADYCICILHISQMIQRLLLYKGLVLRLCQILGVPVFYLASSSTVLSIGSSLKAL